MNKYLAPSQMTDEQLKLHLQTTYTERLHILLNLIRRARRLQNTKLVPIHDLILTKKKIPAITGIMNKIYQGEPS